MAYRDDERHPSFSAPGTLDRKKPQNSFLASAKEMFLKPWRQRKSKRVKRQPKPHSRLPVVPAAQAASATTNSLPYIDQHSSNPFRQGFPNFQNRLAPIGGRPSPSPQRPSKDQVDGEAYTKPDEIKIPEGVSGARPSLKNIFPMFDAAAKSETEAKTTPTPKAAVVKPKLAVEQKTADKPQSAKPSPAGLPIISTIADVAPPPENLPRRHSTPATPTANFLKAAGLEDRRPSASSDTTADKSRQERRDRRASLTRDLPILPKRGQSPSGQGSPVSPYSEYSGPPLISLSPLGGAVQQRPPVAPGGGAGVGGATGGGSGKVQQSFSYPPMWSQQPHQQLQELEEELEEDGEGDGMEEPSFTRIDETSSEYLPKAYKAPPPAKEPSGGGGVAGFGRALKDMMSSKHKSDPVSRKPPGKGRDGGGKGKMLDEEEGPEIKGFDNFFMY